MERALVVGASGGIGSAVAQGLRDRGADVAALSRRDDGLDLADEASIARHVGAQDGPFDLIFVAAGALAICGHAPEKSLKSMTAPGLVDQFQLNAAGPALVLKHALPLMPRDRRVVFAALSARVGSIGDNRLGGWHGYRAAKAALNQLIHGASIELARTHKQAIAVCLHPGTVETRLTADYAAQGKVTPERAARNLLTVIDSLAPHHSGGFFDYSGKEVPW